MKSIVFLLESGAQGWFRLPKTWKLSHSTSFPVVTRGFLWFSLRTASWLKICLFVEDLILLALPDPPEKPQTCSLSPTRRNWYDLYHTTLPSQLPEFVSSLGSHSKSWGPISYVNSGRSPLPSKQNAHMEREIVFLWSIPCSIVAACYTLLNGKTSSQGKEKYYTSFSFMVYVFLSINNPHNWKFKTHHSPKKNV